MSLSFSRMGRSPRDTGRTRRALNRIKTLTLEATPPLEVVDGEVTLNLGDDFAIIGGELSMAFGDEFNETPAGSANGVNDTFVLSREPIPGTVRVYLNGVFMTEDEDYELVSTNMIVFAASQIPQTGDSVVAHYRFEKE